MKKILLIILIFLSVSVSPALAARTPRIIQNLSQLINRAISDTTGTLSISRGGTGTTTVVSGGVMFTDGTTLKQDSVNLFWNDTTNRFGISSTSPSTPLSIKSDSSENAISIQDVSGADFWNIDTLLDNLTFSRNGIKRMEIDGGVGYLRSNFFSGLDGTNFIDMLNSPDITFFTDNNKNQLQMGPSGTVFNNAGDATLGFRIVANAGAGANAFVVDSTFGNVSVGDLTPQGKFEVAGADNALAGVGLSGNYLQILRHNQNITGFSAGLGFAITTTDNNIGAAIIAKRTGGNSQAELQFYTKQSTAGGVAPVQAMVISNAGNIDISGELKQLNGANPNFWVGDVFGYPHLFLGKTNQASSVGDSFGIIAANDGGGIDFQYFTQNELIGTSTMTFFETVTTFNDGSVDRDFIIESNNNANIFKVDAGNDRVGIGTSSPSTLLDIFSIATSTITLDTNSATQGACLKMRDIDGAGYSYGTALNGVITWSQISCE